MESNVVLNRRKKAKKKTVLVVLCIIIALMLLANALVLTIAYFTDRKTGSVSLRTGIIDVSGYVYSETSSSYTTEALTLNDDVIYPGSTTTQKIKLTNSGLGSFYIRLDCAFQLYLNNSYQDSSLLEISNITMPSGATANFVKSTDDGKYYYTGILEASSSIEDIEVTFKVKEDLGNSDLANTTNYQNIAYKMFLDIDVLQAANITLDTTSADTIADKWQ